LEYCEHHRGEPLPTTDEANPDENRKRTIDISEWDQRFITVDHEMLFEIILAANYLDIKPLLWVASCSIRDIPGFLTPLCSEVGCEVVGNMIEGKTPEEIKQLFGMVNDFTPEEEVCSSTCPLESLSDILFVIFQAQFQKENVSHPRCLARLLISSFFIRNGLRNIRSLQKVFPCDFLLSFIIIESYCIVITSVTCVYGCPWKVRLGFVA